MLAAVLDVDGVTAVEILVKTAVSAGSLAAAGSALALLSLTRFDGTAARSVRRTAVAGAAFAAAASVLHIPVRASFLMGGSMAGAFEPAIVGMVVESPLGTSLWVRLGGLALVGLVVVDRRAARAAAGLGSPLYVCKCVCMCVCVCTVCAVPSQKALPLCVFVYIKTVGSARRTAVVRAVSRRTDCVCV